MVHGLTRARGFTQDDAHIYCTDEQMQGEIRSLLQFVLDLLRDYGLDDFYLELSTRNPEKSIGSDEDWERATEALREAAEASGLELVLDPGGAAFYAPKISVQAKDAIGRTWQMSTIQVDLMLPDRFDLTTPPPDGSRQRPVMIHRALFGSIERFFGVLTEHYAGAFPAWLAPVQVVAIPVTDEQVRVRRGRRGGAARPGDPGRGRRRRRPDAEEDPHPHAAEGAVPAARGRPRRRGGRGQLPVPRRHPAQRGAGGRGRRRAGRLGATPGEHLAHGGELPGAGQRRRRPP